MKWKDILDGIVTVVMTVGRVVDSVTPSPKYPMTLVPDSQGLTEPIQTPGAGAGPLTAASEADREYAERLLEPLQRATQGGCQRHPGANHRWGADSLLICAECERESAANFDGLTESQTRGSGPRHTEIVQWLRDNPPICSEHGVPKVLSNHGHSWVCVQCEYRAVPSMNVLVDGQQRPCPDSMLEIALREQQRWSMTSGIPADGCYGILTMGKAEYEEQVERGLKRKSDGFRLFEEGLLKAGPSWIRCDQYGATCDLCGTRLTWFAFILPETFEVRKEFFKEHSLCRPGRKLRESIIDEG